MSASLDVRESCVLSASLKCQHTRGAQCMFVNESVKK